MSHFTNDRIAGKLMAMGILPGCAIKVVRRAPWGRLLYQSGQYPFGASQRRSLHHFGSLTLGASGGAIHQRTVPYCRNR
ncbi:MAG: ferrous iron transport protein A [Haliscomenobacter sp.]|nr:ferrous iron transport protein A [Haliscomenobacter sp.]